MMEQLAERRMQREEEAHQQYPPHPNMHQRTYSSHVQPPVQQPQDEYDEGSEEDDEEDYNDDDYEEEDEEEDVRIKSE